MSQKVDPYADCKRRPAISVQAVQVDDVQVKVLRSSPFLRFQIGEQIVIGHDAHARILSSVPRRLVSLTDSRGIVHYLLEANDDTGGSYSSRYLAWSRLVSNELRFHPSGYVPFDQTLPTGQSGMNNITFELARQMNPGDCLKWQYALNETHEHYRHMGWHVLSDGSMVIPMQRPDREEGHLARWADYVRDLRRRFRTPQDWRHMISMLSGRFMEDLRPREDLTIVKAVACVVDGKSTSPSPHRDRLAKAFCFDGKIAGLNGTDTDLQVEEGVAFGEVGHVAWIFRFRGKVVCVVVDKDEADSAAWVFDTSEAAAHLLHPRLEVDYRDRQKTLRDLAVRWCPHNGMWEVRLRLLVLALLQRAGYAAAEALYSSIAQKDDDTRRVDREVKADLRKWWARPAQPQPTSTQ